MSLGLVSPILNRGVRSRWVATLPASSKMLTIDAAGDVSYTDIPTAAWGSITGTLSSQTDLQNALNAKLSLSGGTMTGAILIPTGTAGAPSIAFTDDTDAGIYRQTNAINFSIGGTLRQQFQGDGSIVLSGTDPYLIIGTSLALSRDGNDILAQKRATAAQTFRIYNTFTDASNYERGKIEWSSNVLRIGTEKAGTGSARALELQTDGTTRLTIASASPTVTIGTAVGTGILQFGVNTTGDLKVSSASLSQLSINQRGEFGVSSSVDGQWRISGWNATNPILCFQGITSSFPAIKRNGTAINFRLADDSADAGITASTATFSGNVTVSAVNIVTDTTTGTKIGTATTQKIGFYNKTPVVQPAAVADATDAASVITQLNLLLSRMRDLGLIAT